MIFGVNRVKLKTIFRIILACAMLFLIFQPAFAQRALENLYPPLFGETLTKDTTLPQFIGYMFNLSLMISGILAFGMIVYAGFKYYTSFGNASRQKDAKDHIVSAFIGLLVVVFSYIILVTINPQLVTLRLPGVLSLPPAAPPAELAYTPKTSPYQEIPTGKFIDMITDENRLVTMLALTESVTPAADELRRVIEEEYLPELQKCSCDSPPPPNSVTSPTCGGDACSLSDVCRGEVCDRIALAEKKLQVDTAARDLRLLIQKTLAIEGESGITETKNLLFRDLTRLERAEAGMKLCDQPPLTYYNMIGLRDSQLANIEIVQWPEVDPGIDAATFYCSSQQIVGYLADAPIDIDIGVPGPYPGPPPPGGIFVPPPSPPANYPCDSCSIPLYDTSAEPASGAKEYFASLYPSSKIYASCPDGLDCWDYIVAQARANGWNPLVPLALWAEESHFSQVSAWDLGCKWWPDDGLAPQNDIVSQVKCFLQHDDRYRNWCLADARTEFCAFMRYWSWGNKCSFGNNPSFYKVFYEKYTQLAQPGSSAYPSGACTPAPEPPPPQPPPSSCPASGNLAELQAYIFANYNVDFRGNNWTSYTAQLRATCNKLDEVKGTNFDEMLRVVRAGDTKGAIIVYDPSVKGAYTMGNIVYMGPAVVSVAAADFPVLLFHELGHVLKQYGPGTSAYLNSMLATVNAEVPVADRDRYLTKYPKEMCTYGGQFTSWDQLNENFAEVIAYYLYPGKTDLTTVNCSGPYPPFSKGDRPNHCDFAENILGFFSGDCGAVAPPSPPAETFACPLNSDFSITCNFNCHLAYKGTDMGTCGAPYLGKPVYAVAAGVVQTFPDPNCGNGINLRTGKNRFTYCHLQSYNVTNGQSVAKGQQIGTTGYTGTVIPANANGSHLHLSAFNESEARINPETDLDIPCIKNAPRCPGQTPSD